MSPAVAEALFRYEALAGLHAELTAAEAAQARLDRLRYAETYLCRDAGGTLIWNPYRIARFLVEVGGLSVAEALDGLTEALVEDLPADPPEARDPEAVAWELLDATGNVFEALWIAQYYAHVLSHTDHPDAARYWATTGEALERVSFGPRAAGAPDLDAPAGAEAPAGR